MTAVLYRVESGSAEREEIPSGGETATSPPDINQRAIDEFGSRRPKWMVSGDETDAWTGIPKVGEFLLSGDPCVITLGGRAMSRGDFQERLLLIHRNLFAGEQVDRAFQYPFALRGLASTDDNPDPLARESTTPAANAEEIPLMLQEALDAISEIRSVALEEGCDEPSTSAMTNAEQVLRTMYYLSPQIYDVYPMGDGEIAIDGGSRGRRIGVFCYPDGSVQYVGWVDNERQEVRKNDTEDIPIDFLRQSLSHLES